MNIRKHDHIQSRVHQTSQKNSLLFMANASIIRKNELTEKKRRERQRFERRALRESQSLCMQGQTSKEGRNDLFRDDATYRHEVAGRLCASTNHPVSCVQSSRVVTDAQHVESPSRLRSIIVEACTSCKKTKNKKTCMQIYTKKLEMYIKKKYKYAPKNEDFAQ